MENNFFKNKKVLILGHNGFKGSWLVLTLINLGAKVYGISLKNKSRMNFYSQNKLGQLINERNIDINDYISLKKTVLKFQPDIIFHLAAQSLVKKSYENPTETWKSNLIGTINILEILRVIKKKCLAVIITSDKCYLNKERKRGYLENDELGGLDPYGASKGAAEIAIRSYFHSFLKDLKNIKLVSARAGNVIGGGDWNENRIVPDCMKSWLKNSTISIRNPNATRPWQHVLDIINGYLSLAYYLNKNNKLNGMSFNFGPSFKKDYPVLQVVKEIQKNIYDFKYKIKKNKLFKKKIKEAQILNLNSSLALKYLKWKPILNINKTIKLTSEWYSFLKYKKNISEISNSQIKTYLENLKKDKKHWLNF